MPGIVCNVMHRMLWRESSGSAAAASSRVLYAGVAQAEMVEQVATEFKLRQHDALALLMHHRFDSSALSRACENEEDHVQSVLQRPPSLLQRAFSGAPLDNSCLLMTDSFSLGTRGYIEPFLPWAVTEDAAIDNKQELLIRRPSLDECTICCAELPGQITEARGSSCARSD